MTVTVPRQLQLSPSIGCWRWARGQGPRDAGDRHSPTIRADSHGMLPSVADPACRRRIALTTGPFVVDSHRGCGRSSRRSGWGDTRALHRAASAARSGPAPWRSACSPSSRGLPSSAHRGANAVDFETSTDADLRGSTHSSEMTVATGFSPWVAGATYRRWVLGTGKWH